MIEDWRASVLAVLGVDKSFDAVNYTSLALNLDTLRSWVRDSLKLCPRQ